ncbi:YCF48-related protein [Hymenobacter negativus]|uniref:T9SS type A sorting domain-containing protein n=1 Tax=Hymenobacter negativus TaxID=2795026 RepID=A0ABS3QDY0_9BACT|nr:YCF48-related protein [Hymenobacter negativus]MBO2009228.1 T9SS type A sorting domain-containing protein [Hymenobacter negativus]
MAALLGWVPGAQAQVPFTVPGAPDWQWQAPRPAGYDLTDIHVFDDQSAIAVGRYGAAMKTTDQGQTWSQLYLGMTYDLMAVSFVTPQLGWVACNTPTNDPSISLPGRGEVRRTTDGGQTWSTQLVGESDFVVMQSIRFFSASEGYVFYYWNAPGYNRPARVQVTHNGGLGWSGITVPPQTTAVQFVSPLVGYLTGYNSVLKTTDGGQTFTDVTPVSMGIAFNKVFFLDAQNGWVAGGFGGSVPNFFHTTDGGASWTIVHIYNPSLNYYPEVTDLNFADGLHGLTDSFITADGGQTWTIGRGMLYYGRTKLRPTGVGFSAGAYGMLMTTTNFGLTGQRRDQRLDNVQTFDRVGFPDPVHGWAIGGNSLLKYLFRTATRGQTWQAMDVPSHAPGVDWSINGLLVGSFPDTDTAYLAGRDYGPASQPVYVLKTVDAGQNWVRLPLTGAASVNDLQFRDCRFGLLVGNLGEVWYTRNGGQSWQRGTSGTTQNLQVVSWGDNTTAYARGTGGVCIKTMDGGATWQPVPIPVFTFGTPPTNLYFVTSQLGFVGDQFLYRTTDGGQTWAPIRNTANQQISGRVTFNSLQEGWVYGGQVYHTSDAGLTWTPQVNVGLGQTSGSFIDRYNGWVVGENGMIVRYSEKFINTAPLARTSYAPGESLAVAFATEGPFLASEQNFEVQLSNALGRFRSGQVQVVGQGLTSPLAVTLPANLPTGSKYRLRVVQAQGLVLGSDNGQDIAIAPAVVPDLVVNTALSLPGGVYRNITVTSTGRLSLTDNFEVSGALLVQDGGVLATGSSAGCAAVTGPGSFTLAAGATLAICDGAGISTTGASGAIQVAGVRSFSPDASYAYTGTVAQVTGPGLPSQVRNLTVDNANQGLTLTQGVSIAQVLRLTAGDLTTGSQPLTLLSSAAGTALIDNTGGLVQGTGTMQRYLNVRNPAGSGYRHYSSPMSNSTVADLVSPGYTPVLNTAYNTSAAPNLVTPFPTLFTYNQNRLSTSLATTITDFDKGWTVPASLATAMVPGQGFTAQVPNNVLVDFTGTFTSGPVSRSSLNRGPQADAGWQLLGNPYPSPLDWSTVTAAQRPDVGAAAYVFQSTGPYTGTYRSCIRGLGEPIIPAGAGYFVRTAAPGLSGEVNLTNANRITTFGPQPAFGRGTADTRARLRLLVSGAGGRDETWLYTEAGATVGVDAEYDAPKLANATGLNLASLSSGSAPLAIQGRPLLGSQEEIIPLTLDVPQPGSFHFEVADLADWGGATLYLADALTGTRQLLAPQTQYSFTLATATAGHTRFSLVLRPAGVLATATVLSTANVNLFPNPAHGNFRLALPPLPGVARAQVTLLNALGQTVQELAIPLGPQGSETELDVQPLPTGVYALRILAGKQVYTRRVVLE